MDRHPPLYNGTSGSREPSHATPNAAHVSRDASNSVHPVARSKPPGLSQPFSPTESITKLGGPIMLKVKSSLEDGAPVQLNLVTLGGMGTTPLTDSNHRRTTGTDGLNSGSSSFSTLVSEGSPEIVASVRHLLSLDYASSHNVLSRQIRRPQFQTRCLFPTPTKAPRSKETWKEPEQWAAKARYVYMFNMLTA